MRQKRSGMRMVDRTGMVRRLPEGECFVLFYHYRPVYVFVVWLHLSMMNFSRRAVRFDFVSMMIRRY